MFLAQFPFHSKTSKQTPRRFFFVGNSRLLLYVLKRSSRLECFFFDFSHLFSLEPTLKIPEVAVISFTFSFSVSVSFFVFVSVSVF